MTVERTRFSNVSNGKRLSISDMLAHIYSFANNWPRLIGGDLMYREGRELFSLQKPEDLFAWIDGRADVSWERGGVSKTEFFAGVMQRAKRHAWASPDWHFPPIPGVLYLCKKPKAEATGALDQFLDFLSPATEIDRELLRAFVLTIFWGGRPGARPAFVVTSESPNDADRGRGVGKTTLVELISSLVGGFISVRPSSNNNHNHMLSSFLSPSSWARRVAVVDNLKSYHFSCAEIESLVTATEINGHKLYRGFAVRPNFLTWAVTINGASFSKDMAQRSVVIRLSRAPTSGNWISDVTRFLEENRDRIVADIAATFKRKPKPIASNLVHRDRWAPWVTEVVGRLKIREDLLRECRVRLKAIDNDDADADEILNHVRACMKLELVVGKKVDAIRALVPSLLAIRWIRNLKPHLNSTQARQLLTQISLPTFKPTRRGDFRGFLWTGEKSNVAVKPLRLEYKPDLWRGAKPTAF